MAVMSAILDISRAFNALWLRIGVLLCFAVFSTHGGCTFPASWTGGWFQSGMPFLIHLNTTHMQSKGECYETESFDKFLLYDRNDDCYRCLVIHAKHDSVLQYKESVCLSKDSMASICETITGDASLYSMFKKVPPPPPMPCPFRPAPFNFAYSRGSGDCSNPPSRAESCTDDSRLLLRYMACPDVPATESNVEELVCLGTWKEGSTRYLIGQLTQVARRNTVISDEDTYRCFVYRGQHSEKGMQYFIAQSGDATCNGLSSPTDGSRTMRLTNSDDEHHRCHFPSWIVDHHKWYSLDHTHQYHFTTKNATLKIMSEDGTFEEKRLVCHSILEHKEKSFIKLVAHVTRGCESGHVCVRVWRRAPHTLAVAAGTLHDLPHTACADDHDVDIDDLGDHDDLSDHDVGDHNHGDTSTQVTLITTSLQPARCPIFGHYSIISSLADRRRRRQKITTEDNHDLQSTECVVSDYDSVSIGCGNAQDSIEFKSPCFSTVYTCYGSWQEGNTGFLIASPVSRGSAHPSHFCFMYTLHTSNESMGYMSGPQVALSVARTCDKTVVPGRGGDKAYNLTANGTCEQSSQYNSRSNHVTSDPFLKFSMVLLVVFLTLLVYGR